MADLEDEGTLVWPRDCLNGDGGRVVGLTIEFSVLDDRPTTMVALLLTLAFIREAGSADVDERDFVLNGEGGRECGLDWAWRVTTLLVFTLAVTFMSCELLDGINRLVE